MRLGMLACAVAMMASTSALAFPPTATTSPGYDRALAESRKARQMEPPPMFVEPPPRYVKPRVQRRHLNRH